LKFTAQTLLADTVWDAENRRIIVKKILVKVTSIRYNSYADYTRVAIDLNAPTNYKVDKLQDPERILLTLYNTSLGVEEGLTPVSDPRFIKYIRAKSSDSTVQVTLDLKRPADYATFTLKKPDRIVVDVKQPPAILVRKEGEREEEVRKETEEEVVAPIKDEIVIVIDPGHGGHDPGAIGPTKLKEKDVVLDVAKRLKNLFKNDKKVKVFLTREGDVFIPLPNRTAFANKKQADIFISIHANAAYSSYAKGIETYYLDKATNKHALEVAMRENAWGFEIMDKAFADETNSLIEAILQDMVMTYKMDESKDLTRYMQTSMTKGLKLIDRKVKGAPFLVLRGTLMPAILVEIAFISNPAEEKLLKTASFRQKVAQSLYQGIKSYVKATKGSWD